MQSQEEENDWYKYTLELPMALEPGEQAIYCSVNPNLIGNLLEAVTGKPLEVLFQELIAEPLQIDQYHLILQPTGDPYMGGGIHWLPRDFMKLGQLMLDDGVWNGRRVISQEWVARSSSSLYEIRGKQYGYLWWVEDYAYKDRTVRGYYAGGNGGQNIVVIPELDLVIEFWGGNYSSRALYRITDVIVPEFILKAVSED
jgi:CubicO group peptidase (beta-lactamase class C family)